MGKRRKKKLNPSAFIDIKRVTSNGRNIIIETPSGKTQEKVFVLGKDKIASIKITTLTKL